MNTNSQETSTWSSGHKQMGFLWQHWDYTQGSNRPVEGAQRLGGSSSIHMCGHSIQNRENHRGAREQCSCLEGLQDLNKDSFMI